MADSDIARILRSDGPALSGDLLLKLQESGLSAEAARKRLSRGSADVAKLKGLVFPKGARFFYHVDDFGSERYWAALVDAIDVASPAYSAAIGALRAHGGIVPRQYFPIVSGAPIRQRKQIGSDTVLSRLTAVGLLEELVIHDVAYVSLGANGWFGGPISGWKNRLFVQEIMLLAVADWARKLSMVSFNSVAIRNLDGELPKFGTHAFDLCGPSYLQPMVRRGSGGGPKPGFLVCDAFVGEIDEAGVASFLRKCETSKALRNLSPFLPILLAGRFSAEAFNLARSKGVVTATPGILFGSDVAKGLSALLETLNHASEVAAENPEVVVDLFDRLGKIEGAAVNLRGALFELIVGHVVHLESQGSIDIGKLVFLIEKHPAEIDVFLASNVQVRVIECKGYGPDQAVKEDELRAWVVEKVPDLRKSLLSEARFRNCEFSFEFWTSGSFTAEALRLAKETIQRTKKYKIQFLNGVEVRKRIRGVNASGLGKVFDEHYAKQPLTRFRGKHLPTEAGTASVDA